MNTINDLMTGNPAFATPEMGLVEVARMMQKNDCGEIPVVRSQSDKKIFGVITDRDICIRAVALGLNPLSMHVEQCMTQPPVIVKDTASLEDCCEIMENKQIRRLPVVDADENLCGMISLADIVRSQETTMAAEVVKKVSEPSANILH